MALNKIDDLKLHKTISNDRSISREKERVSNYQSHLNPNKAVLKRNGHNISISSSPHKHSTRSTSIKKKAISSVGNILLNDNSSMRKLKANHKHLFNYKIDHNYSSHLSMKKSIQNTFISAHHYNGESSQSSIKVNSSHKDKSVKYKQTNDFNIISVQKTITKNASNEYILSSPSEYHRKDRAYNNITSNSNRHSINNSNIKTKKVQYQLSTISSIQTNRPMISKSNIRSSSLKNSSAFLSARKNENYTIITTSKSPNHSNYSSTSFTQIKICLLSNWGNSEFIGLKEIFLQDYNNKRIQVIKCKVINGKQNNIYNLFNVNPSYSSMRKNAMWISQFKLNEFTKGIILEVYFISTCILKGITLANYSGKDKTIGVKDIEIINEHGVVVAKIKIPQAKDSDDNSIQIDVGGNEGKKAIEQYSIKKIVVNRKHYHKKNEIIDKESSLIKSAVNFTIINIESLEDFTENENNKNANENGSDTNNADNAIMSKSKTIISITPLYGSFIDNNSSSSYNNNVKENAIECQRIKIILLTNHGHHKHIGLTNLVFVNERNEVIDMHTQAKEIIAIPRDIATCLNMKMDKRKFENIFNNIYQTIDDRYMWITKRNNESDHNNSNGSNNNKNTYIDIVFNDKIKLSKVVFANYNDPRHLNKGVKKALLQLFTRSNDKHPISECLFYLHKGLGYEHIDYTQELLFPFEKHILSQEELIPFYQINHSLNIPEQQYYTPYLPSGFVLMFQLISNYGHDSLIGLQAIELYDQLGRDILKRSKYSIGFYPLKEPIDKPILLKYINSKLKEDYDNNECSVIVYVFNTPISLSYIKLYNGVFDNDALIGVKDIKVFIDDYIIFEGTLPIASAFNEVEDKANNNETTIVFTGNNELYKESTNGSLANKERIY